MASGEMVQLISVIVSAICLAALLYCGLLRRQKPLSIQSDAGHDTPFPVYLFENANLIDATESARELVMRRPSRLSEFDQLLSILKPYFPTLADDIVDLSANGQMKIRSPRDESLSVDLNRQTNTLRIALGGSDYLQTLLTYEELERAALNKETETLRFLCDNAPQLVWQEDAEGQVVWANRSYLKYSDFKKPTSEVSSGVWPSHRLFDEIVFPMPTDATPLTSRRSVQLHGQDAEHWFDVTSMPGPEGALHYAVDANAIMRAEESQKAFMATIANTFAQLSIGLAIFDRKRRLASYNPAFGDMTGLPVNFLIGRPCIEVVLDRLRDLGKLPEPKDYSSFREQFTALEAQAVNGTYVENWEMPDGQTYRVTGRPHPDGALAFLFEDITAEVSLTRRFRNEIEIGQAILDNMRDAVAVFSVTQTLVTSNAAYAELWGDETNNSQNCPDLRASLKQWKSSCVSSRIWRGIEKFVGTQSERQPWSDNIVLIDGRQITCNIIPLSGGMTMIKFVSAGRQTPTLQKLTMRDQALVAHKF